MTNTSIASRAANITTIIIGVAFLGVTALGIAQPVKAQSAVVATTVAR